MCLCGLQKCIVFSSILSKQNRSIYLLFPQFGRTLFMPRHARASYYITIQTAMHTHVQYEREICAKWFIFTLFSCVQILKKFLIVVSAVVSQPTNQPTNTTQPTGRPASQLSSQSASQPILLLELYVATLSLKKTRPFQTRQLKSSAF